MRAARAALLLCLWAPALLPVACRNPSPSRTERVRRVLDGDSLILESGRTVRLLGIDCPEKDEPWSEEARRFAQNALEGRAVRLEDGEEREDDYGRRLAYVHEGEMFVNLELLRAGLAHVYLKNPRETRAAELIEAQREAIRRKAGIWSVPSPPGNPVVSSARARIFHRPDCPWAGKISERNRVQWDGRGDAFLSGLSPCRTCRP